MVAFLRELPDTDWHPLRVTGVATALKNMDAKTVKAANGAAGSTHAPVGQVIIGGAGLTLMGFTTYAGTITTGPNHHIRHAGNTRSDYIQLFTSHPGRTRTIVGGVTDAMSETYGDAYVPIYNGRASVTSRFPETRTMIPLRPHDGSTISSVTIGFKIRTEHDALPKLPRFRVIRTNMDGRAEPLHSAGGVYNVDSYLNISAATTDVAYYDSGNYQTSQTYSPDQNNVVDLSKYAYFVDFVEELPASINGPSGASPIVVNVDTADGTLTQILRTTMVCTNILTMAPQ